jgi:hypothetical protein
MSDVNIVLFYVMIEKERRNKKRKMDTQRVENAE